MNEIANFLMAMWIIGILIITIALSRRLTKEIKKGGDVIVDARTTYLDARQTFLYILDEYEAKDKDSEEKKKELEQKIENAQKPLTDAANAFRESFQMQAARYKKLVMDLAISGEILLISMAFAIDGYKLDLTLWIIFLGTVVGLIFYLLISLRRIKKDEIAARYFLENFEGPLGPGIAIVWAGLENVSVLKTKTLTFSPAVDAITIPGEESQQINMEPTITYRGKDVFAITQNVGGDLTALEKFVNRILETEIASVSRYILTNTVRTADEVLAIGPKLAEAIDRRIERDYGYFLGVDFDQPQITVYLTDVMEKAREERSKEVIGINTAESKRKQKVQELSVFLDIFDKIPEMASVDPAKKVLIALIVANGKDLITAFGGKLNFNVIQGMESLMSGISGLGTKGPIDKSLMAGNVAELIVRINAMDKEKFKELLNAIVPETKEGAKP